MSDGWLLALVVATLIFFIVVLPITFVWTLLYFDVLRG